MMRQLDERARRLLDDLGAVGSLRDATLEVLLPASADAPRPGALEMIRANEAARHGAFAAPWVIDPADGAARRRSRLPAAEWTRRGTALLRWAGAVPRHEPLRIQMRIPPGICEHRYGRAGAVRLLLDRPFPLLTVQVFPGGLVEARVAACLSSRSVRLARLLLARDGVRSTFHLLPPGEEGLRGLELAAEITNMQQVAGLERDLLRRAAEERRLLEVAAVTSAA